MPTRSWKTLLAGVFVAGLTLTGCSNAEESTTSSDESPAASETDAAQAVDIATDTAVGEESQRIVDLLNAEEDITAEDWEAVLIQVSPKKSRLKNWWSYSIKTCAQHSHLR